MRLEPEMVGLVACCKTKLGVPARAEDLYRSPLFRKARAFCLAHYSRWFILSAKYGLVEAGQVLEPYDCTLLKQGRLARRKWGELVYSQLAERGLASERFVAHAGKVYVMPLAEKLRIETPLAGLGIGRQMAWYGAWERRVVAVWAQGQRPDALP
jgi:hypothetical protein